MRFFYSALLISVLAVASCNSKEPSSLKDIKLESTTDSVSYALAVVFGNQLKQQDMTDIDPQTFAAVLKQVLDGKETVMSMNDAGQYLNSYFQNKQMAKYSGNLEKGRKFLEENGKRPEVTTTASGLQYEVLKMGTGPLPKVGDKVSTHYHGTLIDGKVFDSSVERGQPFSFTVGGGVIEAWTEAIQLMPVGSKFKIYCPTEIAYGQNVRPNGPIEPNMALIFEVELLEIEE